MRISAPLGLLTLLAVNGGNSGPGGSDAAAGGGASGGGGGAEGGSDASCLGTNGDYGFTHFTATAN